MTCVTVSVDMCLCEAQHMLCKMLILDLHFKAWTILKFQFYDGFRLRKSQTINLQMHSSYSYQRRIESNNLFSLPPQFYLSMLLPLTIQPPHCSLISKTIRKLQCLYYLKSNFKMYNASLACMLMCMPLENGAQYVFHA